MKECARWMMGAALFAVMAAAVWRSGLYFSTDLYPVWLGFGLFCAGAGGWGLYRFSRGQTAERLINRMAEASPLAGWVLCSPFLMMLLYAVHGAIGSVSVLGDGNQALRWALYGSFVVLAWLQGSDKRGRLVLAAVWHMTGGLLAMTALLPVYGWFPLPYAIAYTADPEVSATGARLAGMLQYPNTFGAVMALFLLERLFALGQLLQRQPAALPGRVLLGSLPLLPYAAALLLSESRGAWLAAGAACAAGLLMERRRMAAPLVLAAAPLAGAALLYRQLAAAKLAAEPWPGLLTLAGLWAGSMLAGRWLLRLRGEAAGAWRRRLGTAAGGALLAAGAAVIFGTVRERIVHKFGTMSARQAMVQDAWALVKEAPWLGQGGDTWRLSYRAVQSSPYVGSQMHSGYVDVLLNTGLIGLVLLTAMLASAGLLIFRRCRRLLPSYIVFLLHGAVDIDWSYGMVWLLFFLLAAQAAAEPSPVGKKTGGVLASPPERIRRHVPALLSLWLVIALGSSCLAYRGYMGHAEHMQALRSRDNQAAAARLASSLRWNPADYSAALDLAGLVPPPAAEAILRRSLAYAPHHPGLLWALADNAGRRGDAEEAIYWTGAALRQDKYNAGERTRSLECLLQLARAEYTAGHEAEARRIARFGFGLYHDYARAAEDTRLRVIRNDREFALTFEAWEWGRQLAALSGVRARWTVE
uniref:O-antigen ligase family protein n=1 Tax=Paenibacillus terrae TaxID=159743 RepID=UPI00119E3E95|nr:O-antigen ligase family protein [Paenibacillus terrae]